MSLLFEYCFYAGIILALLAIVWFLLSLAKGKKIVPPICLLLFGIVLLAAPAVLTRTLSVSLGPRERMVDGERHLSLTGWDGSSYTFLQTKTDTTVLQMGNADVNDETIKLLSRLSRLRELDINDSSVTDAALATLAQLPSLETLRLRGTKVTDAGFREHLMNSATLNQLDLRQTEISAELVDEWKSVNQSRKAFH